MKEYVEPEMKIVELATEDIVMTSGQDLPFDPDFLERN